MQPFEVTDQANETCVYCGAPSHMSTSEWALAENTLWHKWHDEGITIA
jgi:hypothetical protein